MFDLWEILKYKVKKACHWLKQSVRQFFCKHHYVEGKMLWHGVPGIYCDGIKCTKCGKIAEHKGCEVYVRDCCYKVLNSYEEFIKVMETL